MQDSLFETGPAESQPLAEIRLNTGLSIIIPTYKEVENIPHILNRLDALRQNYDLTLEVLFMDCLLYTSPSPRDLSTSRMPSSA